MKLTWMQKKKRTNRVFIGEKKKNFNFQTPLNVCSD